jgi:hypothetical protein
MQAQHHKEIQIQGDPPIKLFRPKKDAMMPKYNDELIAKNAY